VDDPLQGRSDRLFRRPLAVREPQDALRREVVRLPDPFRVRAGDDQAAAPATEEIRQEAEGLRGSFLLYQVAAAWHEFVVRRRGRLEPGLLGRRSQLRVRRRDA